MQPLRGALSFVFIASSLCKAELNYHTGAVLQTGFQLREVMIVYPETVVGVHIGRASWRGAHAGALGCSSMLGPTCFYTGLQGPPVAPESVITGMHQSSGPPLDHPGRKHTSASLEDAGIMGQYLEASQSLLGAVHGHSDTVSEHWQRVGSARDGRLDDVVHVRVGRGGSVQSVYERTESSRLPVRAGSLVVNDDRRKSIDAALGAVVSPVCKRQPDGELQVITGGGKSQCAWSSSSDKAAEAESASFCLSENTQDEQDSVEGTS